MIARGLTLVGMLALASTARADLPAQWLSGGYHHQGFVADTDAQTLFEGKPSLGIRSTKDIAPDGESTVGTGFQAARYRGKRIRFAASLKSEDVTSWGGLWMRVNGPPDRAGGRERRLRFDNMRDRPVKGSAAWKRYEIVLDVPAEATDVSFGFFLVGAGALWMSDPKIETVGPEVPVTSESGQNLPPEPQLDFNRR